MAYKTHYTHLILQDYGVGHGISNLQYFTNISLPDTSTHFKSHFIC